MVRLRCIPPAQGVYCMYYCAFARVLRAPLIVLSLSAGTISTCCASHSISVDGAFTHLLLPSIVRSLGAENQRRYRSTICASPLPRAYRFAYGAFTHLLPPLHSIVRSLSAETICMHQLRSLGGVHGAFMHPCAVPLFELSLAVLMGWSTSWGVLSVWG